MGSYATVEEVATRLGVTLDAKEEGLVELFIGHAENLVDQYTGRNFKNNVGEEEFFDGDYELDWYYVRNTPLIDVTEIKHNDSILTKDNQYYVYPEYDAVLFDMTLNNLNPRNVKVTYNWGYTKVPEMINNVVLEMVVNCFNSYQASKLLEGAVAASVGDFSVRYENRPMLTEKNKELLRYWQKVGIEAV